MIHSSSSSIVASLRISGTNPARIAVSVSEEVGFNAFMFGLELCDCQSEDLFWRELIIPYFLEESSLFSNHILVWASMRRIKTADINPAIPIQDNQNNRK